MKTLLIVNYIKNKAIRSKLLKQLFLKLLYYIIIQETIHRYINA